MLFSWVSEASETIVWVGESLRSDRLYPRRVEGSEKMVAGEKVLSGTLSITYSLVSNATSTEHNSPAKWRESEGCHEKACEPRETRYRAVFHRILREEVSRRKVSEV